MSPEGLVTGSLEGIEKLNPILNAFIAMTADQALEKARKAEKEIKNGE
jgi:aspartyl-tRNA(Asn)/glutamyl-tRNA(Gln) amidotransferase subunit A